MPPATAFVNITRYKIENVMGTPDNEDFAKVVDACP